MSAQETYCFCQWVLEKELRGEPERALALDHLIPGPEDKLPTQAIAQGGELIWKLGAYRQHTVWRARGKHWASPTLAKGAQMPVLP